MKPAIKFDPTDRPLTESRLVVIDVAKLVGGYVFDTVWGTVRKLLP